MVCIAGDGGLAHVWAELETAVRERLAVTVIVLNNSILGFQKHAELYNFGAHTSAIDFAPVDHAAIARAVGATGLRVEAASDIRPALEKALASDTVTVLDVLTDPDAYPPITAWARPRGRTARLLARRCQGSGRTDRAAAPADPGYN